MTNTDTATEVTQADLPEFCLNVMRAQLATFGVEPACNVDGALSVLRSTPAPDALPALEPEQRCPSCGTRFQKVNDVDAHIDALRTEGKPS